MLQLRDDRLNSNGKFLRFQLYEEGEREDREKGYENIVIGGKSRHLIKRLFFLDFPN